MKAKIINNDFALLYLLSFIILSVVTTITLIIMNDSKTLFENSTKERLESLSISLAAEISADELDKFHTTDDIYDADGNPNPEYLSLVDKMIEFAEIHNLQYAYFMRLTPFPDSDELGMTFIVDNVVFYGSDDEEPYGGLFDGVIERETDPDYALTGHTVSTDLGSYSPGYDRLLSSFSPVYGYDIDGNYAVVAISGVDIMDTELITIRNNVLLITILMITALVLFFGVGFASIVLYRKKAIKSESASLAKSDFLSKMSHEIRTPLNGIVGLTRMAMESDNIEAIKVHLDNIHYSTVHLTQIINDILDISKIEAGKVRLEMTDVNFADEIKKIENIILPQSTNKMQKLIIDIDPKIPESVVIDSVRLRQVLVNLLSNAVKFTDVSGTITLKISLVDRKSDLLYTKFEVIDTGIGISEDKKNILFEPFEQIDNTSTRNTVGTGLGLSISKQIIDLFGGRLDVESRLGKGSDFFFSIWIQTTEKKIVNTFDDIDSSTDLDLSGKIFLLVEDSKINQMIAEDLFKKFKAAVDIAENGLEAYNMYCLNPDKYAIIFMDIQMPVMDGYDATLKIRESGFDTAGTIPIIAMTANVFKEDIEKSLSVGMNGHIGKPFEIDDVKKIIMQVLRTDNKK